MDVIELTKKLVLVSSISVDKNGYNILVKTGHPRVCFAGHLDTVPPFLPVKENKEKIYGRGTGDMKGAMAAMIMAAVKAREEGLSNFGLLFTVGEETSFRGALKCTDSLKDLGFMVVGEPTNLEVVDGHFFTLNAIKLLKIHPQSSLNIGFHQTIIMIT